MGAIALFLLLFCLTGIMVLAAALAGGTSGALEALAITSGVKLGAFVLAGRMVLSSRPARRMAKVPVRVDRRVPRGSRGG
jgi:hypothetical protein